MWFDKITTGQLLDIYDSLGYQSKLELIRNRKTLGRELIERLLRDPTVANSHIWKRRVVDEDLIERFATLESEWRLLSGQYKFTPAFLNKHADDLALDRIDYSRYTVDELLAANNLAFPLDQVRHLSIDDLLKLFHARQLTMRKSGVALDTARSWSRGIVWNSCDLARKGFRFEDYKPLLKVGGDVWQYDGPELVFDDVLWLIDNLHDRVDKHRLEYLLKQGRINVTNEEWDTMMAMLEFSR